MKCKFKSFLFVIVVCWLIMMLWLFMGPLSDGQSDFAGSSDHWKATYSIQFPRFKGGNEGTGIFILTYIGEEQDYMQIQKIQCTYQYGMTMSKFERNFDSENSQPKSFQFENELAWYDDIPKEMTAEVTIDRERTEQILLRRE